ncbi:MAG: fluoride efflux transporter CrcB [Calditrichaeota bacterium]|nr:fluoride efflux transporter CrcB [Calditrichota bacterium]
MTELFYIGMGGFIGAVSRFLLGTYLQSKISSLSQFPIGTFIVNILGCLLIGIIGGLIESKNLFTPQLRLFLLAGVLGGFTTFSTFAFESFNLMSFENFWYFFLNLVGQVILGLFAVWLGIQLIRIS